MVAIVCVKREAARNKICEILGDKERTIRRDAKDNIRIFCEGEEYRWVRISDSVRGERITTLYVQADIPERFGYEWFNSILPRYYGHRDDIIYF